jgi:hypothetical protein
MNDTSPEVERLLQARYAAMTPLERIEIAMSLRRTAIEIIASSLPPGLTREERRYAIAKRFYGDEVSEAALRRHAQYCGPDATGF